MPSTKSKSAIINGKVKERVDRRSYHRQAPPSPEMEHSPRLPTPESILQDALSNLQQRAVVQDTIQSMLIDVELAATLSKELVVMEREEELKQRARASERALQEARAVQQEQVHHKRLLADELVKELWSLATEIGALKRWKDEHQPIVEKHDELIAKLMYAEDQIEELKLRPVVAPAQDTRVPEEPPRVGDGKPIASQELQVSAVPATEIKETLDKFISESKKMELLAGISDEQTKQSKRTIAIQPPDDKEKSEEPVPRLTNEVPEECQNPEAQEDVPVVMILSEDHEEAPGLESLEISILMEVFGFLDAIEILNLAQVNVTFFSRIDSLFGSGEGMMPDPPIPTTIETSPMELTPTVVQMPPDPYVARAPPQTPQPMQTAASKLDAATSPQGRQGIFSILQNRAAAAAAAAAARPRIRGRAPRLAVKQAQPITEAMATSMGAKLTDTELTAIITMRTRLDQREKDVAELLKEKEDLSAKLEGTEAVKQFLIGKVRDVEKTLSKSLEDEAKVAQQVASDQEVIAFLDSRVQELERNERKLLSELKATNEELVRTKNQNSKKTTVLGDMLQFERERSTENEKEFKATKKLLVKEVKHCRSQLTALQAERDGYREQNERLRKAVFTNGASHGSPVRDDRY